MQTHSASSMLLLFDVSVRLMWKARGVVGEAVRLKQEITVCFTIV